MQLNPVIQFVSQQEALNKYLKDNIHDLVQRLKKGKRRMDNLEGAYIHAVSFNCVKVANYFFPYT